jgi:uncharacterized protein (TIGR02300 family)
VTKKPAANAAPPKAKAPAKPAPTAPPAVTERRPTLRKAPTAKKTAVKKAAKRAVARRRDESGPARAPEPVEAPAGIGLAKLGSKFACFKCHAKFYDLGRPEAICPKCGANQKDRPAAVKAPKAPVPPAKRAVKAMAPLLDDDEEQERVPDDDSEAIALGLDLGEVPGDAEDLLDEEIGDEGDDSAEDEDSEEI